MTLAHPNPSPRSGQLLRNLLTQEHDRFVVFDIGARFGAEEYWDSLGPIVEFVGFDPDAAACDYENQRAASNQRFYPYAIGGADGDREFNLTRFPASSGFHATLPRWVERFPVSTMEVMKRFTVPTLSLDSFTRQHGTHHIDFVKVDVEGGEYEVFDGARRCLEDCKVLGIKTEIWWDPVIKGQNGFAEIDLLLRSHGFRFYDLKLHYYPRSALPAGRLNVVMQGDKPWGLGMSPEPYGQAATGDALYFRDPVGELREGRRTIDWDDKTLLRLCGLFDIFDYGDSALEILETYYDQLSRDCDVDALMDAMVPMTNGMTLPYGTYRQHSNWLRQQYNRSKYGSCSWTPAPTSYGKHKKG